LFSTETPFSESERKVFLALMKDTYEQFLSKTLHGRQKAGVSMSRAQLESLAGGRIWTGRQAKANGLVDELGTLQEAIAGARKMAAVPEGTDLEILQLPRPRPFLETLLETQADAELRWWQSLGRPLPGMKGKLRGLQGVLQLRSEPVWLLMPALVEVR
jgi:protease-4